jgi:phosphatidylglycerophosphate synthase
MTTMTPLAEIKERTYKQRDSWWTVLLVDPIAARITRRVAIVRGFTPNRITLFAFALGLAAAASFAVAQPVWLVVGALFYHLSFTFDCVDGKVARLNGSGSIFGAWLDYILDRIKVAICAAALAGGQYLSTHEPIYLWLALVVVFLEMFRALNTMEMREIHSQIADRIPGRDERAPVQLSKMTGGGRSRLFSALRGMLQRSRIRPHLFGGIEFQMAAFIVAPVAAAFVDGAIIWVILAAAALMIVFELAVIYMIYRSTQLADLSTADQAVR